MEANSLVWSQATACFEEIGSCAEDATCLATWNFVGSSAAAAGVTMTQVNGLYALGGIAFTPLISAGVPLVAAQVGGLTAIADMSGNGKVLSMTACMWKDWAATDIQATYLPCFDLAVQCSNTAACAEASSKIKDCAADKDITMQPNAVFTNVYEPLPTASHDDWCTIGTCGSAEGNSLYMALGACGMDTLNFAFKKCYDDMMKQIGMMFMLVGGCSFTVGVLGFTTGWCLMCKGKKSDAHAV